MRPTAAVTLSLSVLASLFIAGASVPLGDIHIIGPLSCYSRTCLTNNIIHWFSSAGYYLGLLDAGYFNKSSNVDLPRFVFDDSVNTTDPAMIYP
jgi:hypothetical protein